MWSNKELAQLCLEVNNIAKLAGEKIKQFFESGYEINYKDDKSPVTSADLVANDFIIEQLKLLTPELPSISEESAETAYATRKLWNAFWLIDPLDGTRQFIKGKPDFTVNIALIDANKPILGVIYLPIEKSLYYATKDQPAFKQLEQESPQIITVTQQPRKTLRVCANKNGIGKRTQGFLQAIGEHEFISRGSSIKSCLVADGKADVYPRFGPTWEWDTAAAQCIVEQAGGLITDLALNKLSYNKESLLNPSFLAFGDQTFDWHSILKQLERAPT